MSFFKNFIPSTLEKDAEEFFKDIVKIPKPPSRPRRGLIGPLSRRPLARAGTRVSRLLSSARRQAGLRRGFGATGVAGRRSAAALAKSGLTKAALKRILPKVIGKGVGGATLTAPFDLLEGLSDLNAVAPKLGLGTSIAQILPIPGFGASVDAFDTLKALGGLASASRGRGQAKPISQRKPQRALLPSKRGNKRTATKRKARTTPSGFVRSGPISKTRKATKGEMFLLNNAKKLACRNLGKEINAAKAIAIASAKALKKCKAVKVSSVRKRK